MHEIAGAREPVVHGTHAGLVGCDLGVRLGPELGMPLLAQLRPPQTGQSPRAGIAGAEREAGKLADAQGAGAVIEGELHGREK